MVLHMHIHHTFTYCDQDGGPHHNYNLTCGDNLLVGGLVGRFGSYLCTLFRLVHRCAEASSVLKIRIYSSSVHYGIYCTCTFTIFIYTVVRLHQDLLMVGTHGTAHAHSPYTHVLWPVFCGDHINRDMWPCDHTPTVETACCR